MKTRAFWHWLIAQEYRHDEVGTFARRIRYVDEEADGSRVVPAGFADHAKAATTEFSRWAAAGRLS